MKPITIAHNLCTNYHKFHHSLQIKVLCVYVCEPKNIYFCILHSIYTPLTPLTPLTPFKTNVSNNKHYTCQLSHLD